MVKNTDLSLPSNYLNVGLDDMSVRSRILTGNHFTYILFILNISIGLFYSSNIFASFLFSSVYTSQLIIHSLIHLLFQSLHRNSRVSKCIK